MTRLRALRPCWWLLPPALALALGFAWRSGALGRQWGRWSGGPPAVEYPAVIDLGERTANEEITSRFQIANRGGQELVVNGVRASCSCGALEREVGGRYEKVEELRLPPGGRADVVVRLTVRVDGAGTFRQTVSFGTNDPTKPEGQINLVFRTRSGGARAYPTAIQFGGLPVGCQERQVVEVLDHDQPPQAVAGVVSSDPERVTVRWVPAEKGAERRDDAVLLGRVEVMPNTARPALLDTAVTVEFADPKIQPIIVQVSGRVRPRVEVVPQSLTLPLSAGTGPVYTGKCLVRGPEDRPWRLEVESASPGLTATLPESATGSVRMVRITWAPAAGEGPGVTRKAVRLRMKLGEETETVAVPVNCEHR